MAMVTEMHLRESEEGRERFNYRGMHRYLITLFTAKAAAVIPDREFVLSLLSSLRKSSSEHGFDVYAYCIMPDRLVMIVRGKTEASDMKQFLSAFRVLSSAGHAARGGVLWARKYRERVLRKAEVTRDVAQGVFKLPLTLGLVVPPRKYEFQGSFILPSVTQRSPRIRTPRKAGRHFPPRRNKPIT
jgi:REP element-mobilizing transposase RayT